MAIEWVDTHAHLDQEEFDADRAEVIARAWAAGVKRIVAIGTTAATSAAAVRLAAEHESVWAAVGIQPNYCAQATPGDWESIVALARQPKVVAIGETGLDRYWDFAPFDMQQEYFERHLRLARELGLPFIVHMRECSRDVLAMLRQAAAWNVPTGTPATSNGMHGGPGASSSDVGPLRGVMHSFTLDESSHDLLDEFLALGMHISFAGMVTYKKSTALREAARRVPTDRILVETDSPYLSPEPLRGKRNEPANVVHTAQRLAEVRGEPLDDFARRTTANAVRLFWPVEVRPDCSRGAAPPR